ncbi:MAG: hypothetical protein Q8M92_02935, partial [Candidatus Subteraquimicrobiales bacterium]|nr:hypothetical protein [Candidatus Subteraquimicrobiales bacterium]
LHLSLRGAERRSNPNIETASPDEHRGRNDIHSVIASERKRAWQSRLNRDQPACRQTGKEVD